MNKDQRRVWRELNKRHLTSSQYRSLEQIEEIVGQTISPHLKKILIEHYLEENAKGMIIKNPSKSKT